MRLDARTDVCGDTDQGCQMAYFQTKNTNLGKFLKFLQRKMLVYFWPCGLFYSHLVYIVAIWYILWPFGIYFVAIWYIFPYLYVVTRKILATLTQTWQIKKRDLKKPFFAKRLWGITRVARWFVWKPKI
jgi:hypothetical protein